MNYYASPFHTHRPGARSFVLGILVLAFFAAAIESEAQLLFSETFDAQASAKVKAVSDPDTEATFVDYSNFVVAGETHSIPEAPNMIEGSAATRGVLMRANFTDGFATAVNFFATDVPGGDPVTFDGDYKLTFDMFLSVGDPVPSGGTEVGVFGIGVDDEFIYGRNYRADFGISGSWGFLAVESGIGGSTGDAALFVGEFQDGNINNIPTAATPPFSDAFPNGAPLFGSPNGQWTAVEIAAVDGQVTLKFNSVVFFEGVPSDQTDGFAMIGYEDPFASVSDDPGFQWGLFDNMRVEVAFAPTIRVERTSGDPTTNVPGAQLPIAFSIQNLADNALTVSEVNIDDPDAGFSLATPLPLVVPPNMTAPLEITFTASGDFGERSAAVEIVSDDAREPMIIQRVGATFAPVFLGHYKFDESEGDVAADSGPVGADGVYQQRDPIAFGLPALAAGTAVGISDPTAGDTGGFITAPVFHTPTMSTSLWITPEEDNSTDDVIFSRNPNFGGGDQMYALVLSEFGNLTFNVFDIPVLESDDDIIVDGEKYHVVITHLDEDGFDNDTAQRTRLYIDGVLVEEAAGALTAGYNDYPASAGAGLRALYVGTRTAAGTGGYTGVVDDLQIYSTELTPDEVAALFANPGSTAVDGGTLPDFAITAVSRDSITGEVQLTWNSRPGANYLIEFSDDSETWEEAIDGVASAGNSTTFTLSAALSGTIRRFFRVVEE